MRDLQGQPHNTLERSPAIRDEAVDTDTKKKNIDEMIEEFKRANPTKNQKRIYRGVF